MKSLANILSILTVSATMMFPGLAMAQDQVSGADGDNDGILQDENDSAATAPSTEGQPLPEPESDNDPLPPVATPTPPEGGIVRQAGVGGRTGYGRAGVLELGGSAGFMASNEFSSVSVNPTIGWFFTDNVQLSAILGFSHFTSEEGDQDATMFSALIEPSYHLPFQRNVFGFLGIGMGGAHVNDVGFGFALAPRLGANILVGRSGVLTPSLSYQYTTHDSEMMEDGTELLAVSTALTANIGYTVMW